MGNCLGKGSYDRNEAYYVALLKVENMDKFSAYEIACTLLMAKFGGNLVVCSTDITLHESFMDQAEEFNDSMIVKFSSLKQANNSYHSEGYPAVFKECIECSTGPVIIALAMNRTNVFHQVIVSAFVKHEVLPGENAPMYDSSLKPFNTRLLLNAALKPERSLEVQATDVESHSDDYDFCLLISFPSMDQAKLWRKSDDYPQ